MGGHGDRAQSGTTEAHRVSLRGEVNAVHAAGTSNDPRSGLARSFMPEFDMYPSMHACSEIYERYVLPCPLHEASYRKPSKSSCPLPHPKKLGAHATRDTLHGSSPNLHDRVPTALVCANGARTKICERKSTQNHKCKVYSYIFLGIYL